MANNKTIPVNETIEDYFSRITDQSQRQDCIDLSELIARASKLKSTMWGPSIVGFGSYHYKYDSGREGDSFLIGFSSRSKDISIYLTEEVLENKELLLKLGKYKENKACLHINRLSDVDSKVLVKLIKNTVDQRTSRHG